MIWTTLKYTCKRELRDVVSMILMVIFPIVLACIVGNALKSDFQSPIVEKETFGLVNDNNYANALLEIFHTDIMKDVINIVEVDSLGDAKKQYEDSVLDGYLYYTEVDKNQEISLYVEDSNTQGTQIAKYVIEKYNTTKAMYTPEIIKNNKAQIITDLIGDTYIVPESLTGNHTPKAFDYYGITLAVLICLYGSLYAIKILSETIIGKHGARVKSITCKKFSIISGILLASFILVCAQVLFLLLFYKFVYGIYLGNNLINLILILGVFIVFTNLFGAALISICKNYNIAYTLANIIILGCTFLASGFVILDLGNGVFANLVENYLPNAVCQNALFSVIYKTDAVDITRYLSVISIWSVALLLIILFTNRRGEMG